MHKLNFSIIDSTQIFARNNLDQFLNFTWGCVSAQQQTSGIGQKNNQWASKSQNNIYMTLIYNFEQFPSILSIRVGYSVHNAISKYINTYFKEQEINANFLKLKWPNDIFLNQQKIGGVLVEFINQTALIGIGVNVNMTKMEIEETQVENIQSLFNNLNQNFNIEKLCELIIEEDEEIVEYYNKNLLYKDMIVNIKQQNYIEENVVLESISKDGAILCRNQLGLILKYFNGQIMK